MNKKYNDLIKLGYQYTGITSNRGDGREEVVARAAHLKVLGNKVRVVTKTDVSPRRGMADSRYTYYVALLWKSEEYKAHEATEQAKTRQMYRERDLAKLADGCTLEELTWMFNYKMASMMKAKVEAAV